MSRKKAADISRPLRDRNRITIAYSGAHPAHMKMLADIDATSIMMLGNWSVGRDTSANGKLLTYLSTALKLRKSSQEIIIIEGTTPSALMAPIINCCSTRPKTIISLSAEDGLYRAFVGKKSFDRILVSAGFRYVSGIITSGDLVATIAKEHLRPMPLEVRYPQLPDKTSKSLLAVEPSVGSHNMLLIGSGSAQCKGVDIAAQSVDILRKRFPDAQLTTVGHLDIKAQPGLNPQGPVEGIKPYLASSSILIHPGRGEAFGIAIIEAMLAGVVPFVSEWTGAASFVKKVDPMLVAPLDAKEFATKITAFWKKNLGDRKQVSDKCREVAKEFVEYSLSQASLKDFILDPRNSS